MPYIVTTKRAFSRVDNPQWNGVLSRRAVATLEEAQAYVSGLVEGLIPWPTQPDATRAAAEQLWPMPESGGTVGPLPDGTVIEVERWTRSKMFRALPTIVRARFRSWPYMTDRQLADAFNANIDAFNAAQS